MTEKRFMIDEDGNITDTETDRTLFVENKYTECNYFLKLLNQLSDENEQLQKQIGNLEHTRDFADEVCVDCERLEKENEQLKQKIKELQGKASSWKITASEQIMEQSKLVKENKQLKKEIEQLHQKIFEMRTNIALERTEISRQTYTGKKNEKEYLTAKEFLDEIEKW